MHEPRGSVDVMLDNVCPAIGLNIRYSAAAYSVPSPTSVTQSSSQYHTGQQRRPLPGPLLTATTDCSQPTGQAATQQMGSLCYTAQWRRADMSCERAHGLHVQSTTSTEDDSRHGRPSELIDRQGPTMLKQAQQAPLRAHSHCCKRPHPLTVHRLLHPPSSHSNLRFTAQATLDDLLNSQQTPQRLLNTRSLAPFPHLGQSRQLAFVPEVAPHPTQARSLCRLCHSSFSSSPAC